MKRFRKAQILGAGALTTAFFGQPQGEAASLNNPRLLQNQGASENELSDLAASDRFKIAALSLSSTEKLRIGGDRIQNSPVSQIRQAQEGGSGTGGGTSKSVGTPKTNAPAPAGGAPHAAKAKKTAPKNDRSPYYTYCQCD